MPLLDVISAGAIVAMGFSVASAPGFDCSSNNCRDSFDNSALITSAVIAAPWAISAFVGALRIDSCDAATATWEKAQPAAAAAATTSATTSTPAP
jgi:hypothetical protein